MKYFTRRRCEAAVNSVQAFLLPPLSHLHATLTHGKPFIQPLFLIPCVRFVTSYIQFTHTQFAKNDAGGQGPSGQTVVLRSQGCPNIASVGTKNMATATHQSAKPRPESIPNYAAPQVSGRKRNSAVLTKIRGFAEKSGSQQQATLTVAVV